MCQDAEDLRYFAYITKEDDMHYCHVFMVDNLVHFLFIILSSYTFRHYYYFLFQELSQEIILTLGEAFEVAYQLALSKDGVAPVYDKSKSMENIAEI